MTRCSRCKLQLEAGNPLPSRLLLAQSQWPSALEALDICWKSRWGQGNTSCHAIPPISTCFNMCQHVSTCFNMFQLAFTNSDNFNIFEWAFTTSAQRWEPSGSPQVHSVFNSVYKLLFSNILNISQHIITVILSWWQHNYRPSQTSSKLRTNHIWLWLIVAPRSPAGQRTSQRSSRSKRSVLDQLERHLQRRLSDWEVRSYLGSLLLHGSLLYDLFSDVLTWDDIGKVDTCWYPAEMKQLLLQWCLDHLRACAVVWQIIRMIGCLCFTYLTCSDSS